jgi:hypothetical protein
MRITKHTPARAEHPDTNRTKGPARDPHTLGMRGKTLTILQRTTA